MKSIFLRSLRDTFENVEVINLGVGGYGVDQELLALRYNGFQYKPDLVLAYVAHYGAQRHMHTNRWGREKPKFELIDGQLTLVNSPVKKVKKEPRSLAEKSHRWIVNHSRVYRIISSAIQRAASAENVQSSAADVARQDELRLENESFKSMMYKLGAEIVFSMDSESSIHGAKFVLVTHIDELHNAALEREIASVNVSASLSNSTYPLPDNLAHINEAGNGALAWEVAKFLVDSELIPGNHMK